MHCTVMKCNETVSDRPHVAERLQSSRLSPLFAIVGYYTKISTQTRGEIKIARTLRDQGGRMMGRIDVRGRMDVEMSTNLSVAASLDVSSLLN